MTAVIGLLIFLIVVGVVIGLVFYIVQALPVPDPLGRIIKVIAMVIGIVAIMVVLLQFAGWPVPALR